MEEMKPRYDQMRRRLKLALPAFLLLQLLIPHIESFKWHPPTPPFLAPRPLCSSQFALANYACGRLALNPELPLPPPPPPDDDDDDDDDDDGGDKDDDDKHKHKHKRRHRHHHKHAHQHSQIAVDCCRWAKEVDSECVCEVLVHLANFLSKPAHAFTISVTDDCSITYSCRGRIKL